MTPKLPTVRLIEPHVLGHGPLLFDLLIGALAPHCGHITVLHPAAELYESVPQIAANWSAETGTRVDVEPYALPPGADRMDPSWTIGQAAAPSADVSLITFVDRTVAGPIDLPAELEEGRPRIFGIWFWVAQREPGLSRLLRRLYDSRIQFEERSIKLQQRKPQWLDGCFYLDETAPSRVAFTGPEYVLPDTRRTRSRASRDELRRRFDLPLDRTLFLHIGGDHDRKGFADVLEAWIDVPHDAVVVRAGEVSEKNAAIMKRRVAEGRAIHRPGWVPESEIDDLVRAADWMLLPYRRHAFPSGLLTAAAMAQRPVVASDYGLIGRRMREHGLGRMYKHESVQGLAEAVRGAVAEPIEKYRVALDAYAETQSLENFERTLVSAMLGPEASARSESSSPRS